MPLSRSPCDGFGDEYGFHSRNLTPVLLDVARILSAHALQKLAALQFRRAGPLNFPYWDPVAICDILRFSSRPLQFATMLMRGVG